MPRRSDHTRRMGWRGCTVVRTDLGCDRQSRRAAGHGASSRRGPLVAASTLALLVGIVVPAEAADVAPGYPGEPANWSPGDKDGFGTAIGAPDSKVWYTLNDGVLSE